MWIEQLLLCGLQLPAIKSPDRTSIAVYGLRAAGATESDLYPRNQLTRRKWLDDIIIGPNLETDNQVGFFGTCGQ